MFPRHFNPSVAVLIVAIAMTGWLGYRLGRSDAPAPENTAAALEGQIRMGWRF